MSDPRQTHFENDIRQMVIDKVAARYAQTKTPRHSLLGALLPDPDSRLWTIAKNATVSVLTFVAITGGYVAGIPHVLNAMDRASAESERGLTSGESAIVKALFGQDFRTDNITLYFHTDTPRGMGNSEAAQTSLAYVAETSPDNVHVTATDFHSHDYSKETSTALIGGIIFHELAHTWQFRSGQPHTECVGDTVEDHYGYTLDETSDFAQFCLEQQPELIRDYTQRFLMPDNPLHYNLAQMEAGMHMQGATQVSLMNAHDTQLARVVEEALPHVREHRLRLQADFNTAATCAITITMNDRQISYGEAFNTCAQKHIRTLDGSPLDIPTSRAQPVPLPEALPKPLDESTPTAAVKPVAKPVTLRLG